MAAMQRLVALPVSRMLLLVILLLLLASLMVLQEACPIKPQNRLSNLMK
jgi:hypothetical protein